MNYRHAYHAGGFADVVKHLALVAALIHLRRKETPFFVADTHGGAGLYDLAAGAARRTGEAAAGIEKLRPLAGTTGLPEALAAYLELATRDGAAHYPGSPLIAARLLRPRDRLVAIERHPEEAEALKAALAPFANARAVLGDGYRRLPALLPPPERRGLVLIDPPYEEIDEFAQAGAALAAAWRRFATGIYLLWFPIKSRAAAEAMCGEVLAAGVDKSLRIDIETAASANGDNKRLTAAGLVVVNPPYGFDAEMRACGEIVAKKLGADTRVTLAWLAGEDA